MRLAIAAAFFAACLPSYAVGASAFRAGVARIDITPELPIWLAGYADRTHPADSVLQHLYAKALAIQDEGKHTVVIVTTDLLGLTAPISNAVAGRVLKQYGLARSDVLFNSSHTHTGPVIRSSLIGTYQLGPEDAARIQRYSEALPGKLLKVIGEALQNLAPASISYSRGEAHFAVNRREPTPDGIKLGINPNGPVDPLVPLLAVHSDSHKLLAILFGYSCHNTTLMGTFYAISGDYAGFAQAALEKAHAGATAMFLQLCGGDQVPNPRPGVEHARAHGQSLATAVDRALGGSSTPLHGPIRSTYESIDLQFAPFTREVFEHDLTSPNRSRRVRAAGMLKLYETGQPPQSLAFPIQAIRFNQGLTLFALGGEDVVEYALRAKREFPGNVVVAGYSNDVMCYIPTKVMLREGGYEPVDSMAPYDKPGPFAEDVEERIFRG
ncbi:MAG: neutral/alkaline non-lysosomal ceramidase N-terminal domain-containing protein, partial [Acidobacteriota bacterium]|nr:neutral/alkaline non-lysosomal ceramidase N-terminal domain-containing protein [Acidobacteriota bacterium]